MENLNNEAEEDVEEEEEQTPQGGLSDEEVSKILLCRCCNRRCLQKISVQEFQDHRKRFADYSMGELNYNILQKLKKCVRPNMPFRAFPLDKSVFPHENGEICFISYCKVFGINKKRLDRLGKLAKEEMNATFQLAMAMGEADQSGDEAAAALAAALPEVPAKKPRKPYTRKDPGHGKRPVLPRSRYSTGQSGTAQIAAAAAQMVAAQKKQSDRRSSGSATALPINVTDAMPLAVAAAAAATTNKGRKRNSSTII